MTTFLHQRGGQDHDRFSGHDEFIAPDVAARTDDGGGDDITAGQKMLSAMSGSLLTSLLSMLSPPRLLLRCSRTIELTEAKQ